MQSMATLEPLELEASGLAAPELAPDDELELPLAVLEAWLELLEAVELPAAEPPDAAPELACEAPELAPEPALCVALELDVDPPFSPPSPASLFDEQAAESMTAVEKIVPKRKRIRNLPNGEWGSIPPIFHRAAFGDARKTMVSRDRVCRLW